jgi:hypothetical protein
LASNVPRPLLARLKTGLPAPRQRTNRSIRSVPVPPTAALGNSAPYVHVVLAVAQRGRVVVLDHAASHARPLTRLREVELGNVRYSIAALPADADAAAERSVGLHCGVQSALHVRQAARRIGRAHAGEDIAVQRHESHGQRHAGHLGRDGDARAERPVEDGPPKQPSSRARS